MHYSVDNGKSTGAYNAYQETKLGFFDVADCKKRIEKHIAEISPNAKDISVVITNFIRISKKSFLHNRDRITTTI